MPPFQPLSSLKRKSNYFEDASRKRHASESERTLDNENITTQGRASGEEYWMVQWRNPQYRKHKTWDGDGVLVVLRQKATLYDLDGKIMLSGNADRPLSEGANLSVGGKELEVDSAITRQDYLSGKCFGSGATFPPTSLPDTTKDLQKKFVPPILGPGQSLQANKDRGVPLQAVDLLANAPSSAMKEDSPKVKVENSHWIVNWRKQQGKKHKTWDGDAFLSHIGSKLTMISEEGKLMGTTAWKGQELHPGFYLYIGGKEVELDSQVPQSDLPNITLRGSPTPEPAPKEEATPLYSFSHNEPAKVKPVDASSNKPFVTPNSFYGTTAKPKPKGPLHDPGAEGAVVMKAPNKEHMKKYNKHNLPVVPVVIDPILSRRMRDHQKEGVKFLYECVMGLRKHEGQGCILADEMGLGKTLQTISLIWTLLKQNPYAGVGPFVEKVMIVCPVSLVNNWKAEFHKWLGKDRVGIVTCDKNKNAIPVYTNSKKLPVLIIGYERLRTVVDQLAFCIPPIGLIICDEGHRLKSANNKTSSMFNKLKTTRRVILSGTPIQNDLGEFHAMADFCNPGLLDDYNTFRRVYVTPILNGRAPGASKAEMELGDGRSAQLLTIAKSFVLRRDATLLKNYLPPKHEYVVFVTPTRLQLEIFAKILNPTRLDDLEQTSTAESLALINILTKISNSPILLKATADKVKSKPNQSASWIERVGMDDALGLLPTGAQVEDVSLSGKLILLSKMLETIRQNTEEKCVLVSHYTSTLNILEAYCKKRNYSYYRLDGQTPQPKRQEYVNAFNKSSQRSSFIFLLSSKAGGVGINLIGASRLCLIDSDWNPSHDLQSMARCHRDGQKRPVFIYRFLTAGTIDEKIFQRQVTKLGLSDSLMGGVNKQNKSDSFTRKDLRDIFRVHPNTACNTHDLLECPCGKVALASIEDLPEDDEDDMPLEEGFIAASELTTEDNDKSDKLYIQKKKAGLASLGSWTHINCLTAIARDQVQDDVLRKLIFAIKEGHNSQSDSSLLSSVDLNNITAMDETCSVRDVPDGSISFLFEKSSKTGLDRCS
ncbi:P-loop containing nucleoside triphosphate hydrolase protein [Crucibulum laeve]|uniref:P-loop containing nucleoside triphosphate hydrolase protein n=1 Tax=Crucibulum laeve TaxID=68775 RepID=A0A5C3MIS9_9AGAR|nr:P-loop containing nucleoside triphosphate hydrolase protein [Crucibulum laeve]